ncbi:hypothetical protein BU26DRAFT_387143, partial [Trematosphaeria pertusa]
MKSYTAAIGLAAFVSTVAGHGYIKSPTARSPGDAMQAACGQQVFNMFSSDINGNVQTALQIASSQSDFDAAACDIWLCKGMKYEDNTANVQSYTAGQEVPIVVNIAAPHTGTANVSIVKASTDTMVGSILKSWTDYASTATGVTEDETNFSITMPTDLGDECATAGDCVIQWWWDARSIDQTYESCIDFTMGGSGSGSGSAPAASSSAASTSAPAATPSASATATPTVAQNVQTSTATTPT